MSDTQQRIDDIVKSSDVVLFMKGTAQFPMCGFSGRAIQVLKACGVTKPATVNVLEDEEIRNGIKEYSNWPTIPQLYIKGEFIGGSDIMSEMFQNGELQQALRGQVVDRGHTVRGQEDAAQMAIGDAQARGDLGAERLAVGQVFGWRLGGHSKAFAGPCTQIKVFAAFTAKRPENIDRRIHAEAATSRA